MVEGDAEDAVAAVYVGVCGIDFIGGFMCGRLRSL